MLAVSESPDEDLLDGETEVEVRGLHDLDRSGMSLSIVVDGAVGIRKHGERDQLLPRERGPDSEKHHEVREGGADLGVLQDDVEEATPDGRCDVEMPIRLIIFDDVLIA